MRGIGQAAQRIRRVEPSHQMGERSLPLTGIRVLDVGTFIAAPFSASALGEFGAEVIKIEQPGIGDPLRKFGVQSKREDTFCWLSEARNKRSVTLNLRSEKGAALLKKLVACSDVLCENFRAGTLEKWGLGWDELSDINPGLVMLRISGYGQSGPYKDRPGFARIAHAFGGLAHMTGMPGGPPLTPGSTSLADYISGVYGAMGVLLALREKDRSGKGQVIDLALYEPILRILDDLAPAYAALGIGRDRLGMGTPNACPHGHYQARDEGWVAIACTSDKMFARLATMIDRVDLASPDTYAMAALRIADSEKIDGIVGDWVGARERDEVVDICIANEVPCAPVNTIADIFEDPHYKARENLVVVPDPDTGDVVLPDCIPRLSATPGQVSHLGPRLGDSNNDIYGNLLGLSADDMATLEADGVI